MNDTPEQEIVEIFPDVVDSTMQTDAASCWRKFYYGRILGLANPGANIHLNAGGAYAKGLEVYRKEYYSGNSDFERARALGMLALIREYGDPDFDVSETKQWHRVAEAYLSYIHHWGANTDYLVPAKLDGVNPSVEFSFAIPLEVRNPQTGDPLIFSGRADFVGDFNSMRFIVDDKTTSQLGASWSQQWDLRAQFTAYCWAAGVHKIDVAGAIIRGTAILKTKINHAEAIVYRPQWMIDAWHERMLERTQEMRVRFIDGAWPQNGQENGSCSEYGGCPFQRLCLSNKPEDWYSTYVVSRWNPLEKK